MRTWLVVALAASLSVLVARTASAQQPWSAPPPPTRQQQWPGDPAPSTQPESRGVETKGKKARARATQPGLDEADQLSPRQLDQRPPRQPSDQTGTVPANPPAAAGRAIACNGVFGKSSTHLKLATRFGSENVTFGEVDGPESSKLMASVVFPKDPKRRLEVLWQNEAARADTHLIVINGQSTWTAPKGLRLGLGLAALQKLNGKPFKLAGFDQPNAGTVSDWQGGSLDALPGGCRVGLRLVPDAKAPEAARNEAVGAELVSTDDKVRAVKPIVAEIILGY